jgi:CCR4-NOT transcriptional regulation complex NOT5 subunit
MENLNLKDLKMILTNYKKDKIPPSITGLKKDDLIKLINKYNMIEILNINDVNDISKLYKPKKERKPRKPKPTPEEEAQKQAERDKKLLETKKWMEEQRKLRKQ